MSFKVLIADDERNIVWFKCVMKREGCDGVLARRPTNARGREGSRWVLLDAILPDVLGLTSAALRRNGKIPLVMLEVQRHDTKFAPRVGVDTDAEITQPFSMGDRMQKIRKMLS